MSVLPTGKQWTRHVGVRERRRHVMRQLRPVLALADEASTTARARATAMSADMPDGDYVAAQFMLAAFETGESTGVSFADALNCILDKLDAEQLSAAAAVGAPA